MRYTGNNGPVILLVKYNIVGYILKKCGLTEIVICLTKEYIFK